MGNPVNTELVQRYCEGCLSTAEEEVILRWIRESPDNADSFHRLCDEWKQSHAGTDASMRTALAVKARIAARRRAWLRRRVIPAAAVVLFALIAGVELKLKDMRDNDFIVVSVSTGERSEQILPDSTRVWVNSGSTLSWRNSDFRRHKRVVSLNGEAYFEVRKDILNPFTVNTENCGITVLGTKFNLCDYNDGKPVEASLIEGSIRISAGGNSRMMVPGDLVSYDGKAMITSKVDARQYIGWVNGSITYDEITLPMFLGRLERIYDVKFDLRADKLGQRKFRVSFTQEETLDQILSSISALLPIHITSENGCFIVTDNN